MSEKRKKFIQLMQFIINFLYMQKDDSNTEKVNHQQSMLMVNQDFDFCPIAAHHVSTCRN